MPINQTLHFKGVFVQNLLAYHHSKMLNEAGSTGVIRSFVRACSGVTAG